MPLPSRARKLVLPKIVLTEIIEPSDFDGNEFCVSDLPVPHCYFTIIRGGRKSSITSIFDARAKSLFNLFPAVVDSQGAPWPEANIYLIFRVQDCAIPVMTTYASIADDLAAYLEFLESADKNWWNFPKFKPHRPTYLFDAHLAREVQAGKMAATTARRRICSVIGFYRWLQIDGGFIPDNPPWKENDRYLIFLDTAGCQIVKKVMTSDLGVNINVQPDPYSESIHDGEKLRPLTQEEQGWLVKALLRHENTEMTLIHLFGLLTGARLQSIGTFQFRHTLLGYEIGAAAAIRLAIGPGTGIDTKFNKKLVLHIPTWFFRMLQTYALSKRARHRRSIAVGGDNLCQYLFLSERGTPIYDSKASQAGFDNEKAIRHAKNGQSVRQFIKERMLPFVQDGFDKSFYYRFHDMRATYGMNLTDQQLERVARGEITLHQAREFVKAMMGHESSATTDLYLNYRARLKLVRQVGDDYHEHLRQLCESATARWN